MFNIVKMPDGDLRPPDKTFNVRVYSNMDRDMWDGGSRGETLRGWFQKHAEQRGMEVWNPEKTKYVVPKIVLVSQQAGQRRMFLWWIITGVKF